MISILFETNFMNSVNRTGECVSLYDGDLAGVNGLAFGGPKGDTLYAVVAGNYVDTANAAIVPTGKGGGSLYAVEGLGAIGQETHPFRVSKTCQHAIVKHSHYNYSFEYSSSYSYGYIQEYSSNSIQLT